MELDEQYPIVAHLQIDSGTFTVADGHWSVFDNSGNVVYGPTAVSLVTGSGTGTVIAAALLNPTSCGLAVGSYVVRFNITGTGSDGLYRVLQPEAPVDVQANGFWTAGGPLQATFGEERPVYGTLEIGDRTFTCTGATYDVIKTDGSQLVTAAAADGYDTGAQTGQLRAWAIIDPTNMGLTVGTNLVSLRIGCKAADNLQRYYRVNVLLSVTGAD